MKPNDRTERERALFEHALDLPTDAERHAYLARACAGNDTLRVTVEELLRHHAAEDFLSGPAVVEGPPTFVEPSRIVECPGSRIGHYKLLQQIGEGGCGVVYMAEQEEPVRRRVALKIIKPGMDTRSVIARFEAERQALAMMDHPNIAHVLDAGATDSGRPYFVMELVRGIRITEYCDQNKLSTAARLKLFTQVCQAVQHAHQKGIIHRDLKPSNILVTVNDGVPVPKVIDFGIAKAVEGRLTDQTLFTAFEQFLGTPAYMSPEQAAMTSLDVDTRSDIYSLGVLLYELLTGRTPFDQKELMRGGLDGMRRVLREQEPQRPSTRLSTLANGDRATIAAARASDLSGLVTSITGDLDWIVMRCLEKDRTRRYETANGLAADIQRHLDNEPVVARPPSRIYTLQKLVRRNQLAVAAATAVLVALLAGLGIASWAFVRERSARQRAALEAARSRQTAEFLQDMLQGVGPSVALGRDTTLLREILDRTAARLSTDLKDQPEVEAELRDTIGRVYEEFAEHERARAMHERAVELRRKRYGEDHTNTARSVRLLGTSRNSIYLSGELEQQRETERLLRQALATQRKFLGETNLEVADTLMQLSYALLNLGQRDDLEKAQLKQLNEEAVESSRRVVDIHRKYFTGDHPTLARSLRELGHSFARADRAAEGEPYYREALAMQRRLLGGEHPEVAHAMRYMAFGLYHQGKYEESERLYRQALAQYRKYLGNDNRHVASVLMELGNVFTFLERWDEAANLAAELVACERRRTGPETVEAAWALRLQAWWTYNGGKPAEAEPLAREALALQRKLRGENDPMVMNLLTLVASCRLRQGKVEEARDFAQQAQTSFARLPPGKVFVQERVSLATLLNILAATAFQTDQYRETESYVRQALKVLEPQALSDNPNVRETRSLSHFNLGSVLMAQQRYPEAEEHLKAALDAAQDDFARAELRDSRGQLRAWSGNWSGAAEDLTKAFELQPTNHWHTLRLAAVLLETGDKADYQRLRTDSLAAFAGAADPWIAERIAKSAAMLPLSPKEAAAADRLADKAVRDGEGPYHAWCQLTKALTEFRLGHHAAAADWAGKVVDAGKPYTRQTMGLMILAMSRHALGQDAEARASLKQGTELYAGLPKPGEGGAIIDNWHDLVFDKILLREAESLILNGASAAR